MIKQIGEKWRGFWRMASNLALSMDTDSLEDIHRRIKRLEAAVVQSEVGREPVGGELLMPRREFRIVRRSGVSTHSVQRFAAHGDECPAQIAGVVPLRERWTR